MARHTFSGVAGIEMSVTPSGDRASKIAFITAGWAANRTDFPDAFCTDGIVGTRGDVVADFENGKSDARGACRSSKRPGQKLAAFVVLRFFVERLADALDQSSVHLSVDNHRIDDHADIVRSDHFDDFDHAGVGIDFDFADVAARRIGEVFGS